MVCSAEVQDRICGVLTGMAAGDALGAGYEFNPPMHAQAEVSIIREGLGNFAPGEWTDDTSMAIVIARSLIGATTGLQSIPEQWIAMIQGWPGLRILDLVEISHGLAR